MTPATRTLLTTSIRRYLGTVGKGMAAHNKRYVRDTFPKRLLRHMMCALERKLYEVLGDAGSPSAAVFDGKTVKDYVKPAARRFVHCISDLN